MTAQIIYGTDFKRSNPKSDRAFWIGQTEAELIIASEALRTTTIDPAETPVRLSESGD